MEPDCANSLKDSKAKLDYLKELLIDRKMLASDPCTYLHLGNILENEILKVRSSLFSSYGICTISDVELPEPEGPKLCTQTKVYMPADASSSFNFVGRILGPDGSTAKCLQQCLGVKIMVRGRGSMRDRKKEEANIGKPNWEHLNDRLHIVLAVEDYANRAKARLAKASDCIGMFLKESMKRSDKEDKIKQMQLMELSFRRDSCRPWQCNRNSVTDPSLSSKASSAFSHAANLLNFGYSFWQPPLFPSFQDSEQSHHLHHSPHFSTLGQSPAPALSATNQHGPLTSLPPQFPSNFSTTVLFDHGPLPGNFSCSYTPNSGHPQPGPPVANSLTTGSLAMAPVSYWPNPPIPQLTPQLTESHSSVTTNGLTPYDNGTIAPVGGSIISAVTNSNGPPSQPGNGAAYSVFLSQPVQSQLSGTLPEYTAQYVFTDYAASGLNGAPDLDAHDQSLVANGGLHSTVYYSPASSAWSAAPSGAGSSFHGDLPKYGSKQRYSQRHAYQANHHSPSGTVKPSPGNYCSARPKGHRNRQSPKCNGEIPKRKEEKVVLPRHTIHSNESLDKVSVAKPCASASVQQVKKPISSTVNISTTHTGLHLDSDWPELGASTPDPLRDKSSSRIMVSEP